jgi:hypothetical protein
MNSCEKLKWDEKVIYRRQTREVRPSLWPPREGEILGSLFLFFGLEEKKKENIIEDYFVR